MIKTVIRAVKNIFTTKNNIMSHDANGEPCAVCRKPMYKNKESLRWHLEKRCTQNAGESSLSKKL